MIAFAFESLRLEGGPTPTRPSDLVAQLVSAACLRTGQMPVRSDSDGACDRSGQAKRGHRATPKLIAARSLDPRPNNPKRQDDRYDMTRPLSFGCDAIQCTSQAKLDPIDQRTLATTTNTQIHSEIFEAAGFTLATRHSNDHDVT